MTHNAPKKHHFVPVCYLKAFTNAQKCFWRKRLDNGRITITTPAKICYEEDGNRFNVEHNLYFNGITDEYHIEKHAFKLQENNYGKIISMITRHHTGPLELDANEYHLFIKTLITIKRRNPSFREGLIKAFREGYNSEEGFRKFKQFWAEVSEQTGAQMPSDHKIKEMLVARAQDSSHLRDMYLSSYVNQSSDTAILSVCDEVFRLKQYIMYTPTGFQFITSDNPGFIYFDNRIESATGFGGEYEFYFPLSPIICLYVKSSEIDNSDTLKKSLHYQLVDPERVHFINTATKTVSSKIIISPDQNILIEI